MPMRRTIGLIIMLPAHFSIQKSNEQRHRDRDREQVLLSTSFFSQALPAQETIGHPREVARSIKFWSLLIALRLPLSLTRIHA
jgi:hypothetical protein